MIMSHEAKKTNTGPGGMYMDDMDTDMDETSEELSNVQLYVVPAVQPPEQPYQKLPPRNWDDWEYKMRRQMQEIIPGLFLGPYAAASRSQLDNLKGNGISHIICVRHVQERAAIRPVHEGTFHYFVIEMGDEGTEAFIPFLTQAHKFLDNCFASGGKCLVHGNAGMSRSASIVIAYVMATYGVSLKNAYAYVQNKRFSANLTDWLFSQLQAYEPIYQARHSVPRPLPGEMELHPMQRLKRQVDEDMN